MSAVPDMSGQVSQLRALYAGREPEPRELPAALDAERAVLGSVLAQPQAWLQVADALTSEDFYGRDHALIWDAIKAHADAGKPFDAVSVAEWFSARGMEDRVGMSMLVSLVTSDGFRAGNVRAYADIVREKSTLRSLIEAGTDAVNAGFQPNGRDTAELVGLLQQRIARVAGERALGTARSMREIASTWFDALQRMYESPTTAHGLLTPWSGLNRLTNGFYDGDLVVMAGRPGMGKSAAALGVSVSAALRGERGMFFALEMTDVSLFNRAAASLADVPLAWLRKPDANSEDDAYWPKIADAVRTLRDAPLVIDSTAGLTCDAIIARAKREHMRNPLRFVVVDHMHLIQLPKRENGATEVGDIAHAMKALAKSLGCPVILLAQLNRGVESRPDKRPRMSDLRESGAIEQDADTIVLLYRDDYYAEQEVRASQHPGVIEMIVTKQREGETGTAYAKSALHVGRIDDMPDDWRPPQKQQPAARPSRGFGGKAAAGGDEW